MESLYSLSNSMFLRWTIVQMICYEFGIEKIISCVGFKLEKKGGECVIEHGWK